MASPNDSWQDRRGMFQKGKELHQPGRKLSNQFGDPLRRASVGSNASSTLEKTTSTEEPGQSRRRSSNANGLFNNLAAQKRGSEDYGERRASYTEMAGNSPGLVSGWFNRTFKGMEKPPTSPSGTALGGAAKMTDPAQGKKMDERRGVME